MEVVCIEELEALTPNLNACYAGVYILSIVKQSAGESTDEVKKGK